VPERRPNRVLGPGHDEFWAHCANGELRMQRCADCQHLSWPPVVDCERCGRGNVTWEQLSGRGKVVSWCTFERRYYAELDPPYDTILVELDEGALFIANPAGFENDDTIGGLPVQVTWVDCEDDAGSFRLPVFERQEA
jgi:uncharacterized OB-fold protein